MKKEKKIDLKNENDEINDQFCQFFKIMNSIPAIAFHCKKDTFPIILFFVSIKNHSFIQKNSHLISPTPM